MDARQQRGLEIAARCRVVRKGLDWSVPSQSGAGKYTVTGLPFSMDGEAPTCTCPDYETRAVKCKHIIAVEYVIERERNADGSTTVTETVRVTKTVKRTYPQNWPAYNAAQTHEGVRVPELLRGLCDGIGSPTQTMGRPRLPLADVVFSAVLKVYTTVSGRRAVSDLRVCQGNGHLARAPHYNSVFRALENPALTPLLKVLVKESAAPLRAVEADFAVDASGFSTSTYARWFDAKYGAMRTEHQWIKAHLMVGVKTHVVTSVEITEGNANDSPYLPALVGATADRFQISEVSADKGYLSGKNLAAIAEVGAVPYIPFKVNSVGEGPELWRKLWHFYQFNRQAFLEHYHKRSNVETAFAMIKAKFGGAVRSKMPIAQVNEVLCKVICHNLCVLVESMYELGLEPTFWADTAAASKVRLAGDL